MASAQHAAGSARIVKLDASQDLTKTQKSKKAAKSGADGDKRKKRKAGQEQSTDEESDEEIDFVNVDLDFFGFIERDYLSVKTLLTQLFSHDAKDLDVAGIADHFIEQEEDVGTAIKSDGEQSDPLAFIGALPWRTEKPYIQSLKEYLLRKIEQKPQLLAALQDTSKRIGIVLQERLVNMPPQVVTPLFRIFDDEMQTTGEPFDFTHLLFVSKTFLASPEDFPEDDSMAVDVPKQKKKKSKSSKGSQAASQGYLYHLEDEMIAHIAGSDFWTEYAFDNAPKRGQMGDSDDFGVEMRGRVALIDRNRLKDLVAETEKAFAN